MKASREEEKLRQYCLQRGGVCLKLSAPERGFPDRTVFLPPSQVLFIEFKIGKDKESSHQVYWREKLTNMGHVCIVVHSAQEAIDYIEEHYENLPPARLPARRSKRR